jgi:hypothetical protein
VTVYKDMQRLAEIRDDESKSIDIRHNAAVDLFNMLNQELTRSQQKAMALYAIKPHGVSSDRTQFDSSKSI